MVPGHTTVLCYCVMTLCYTTVCFDTVLLYCVMVLCYGTVLWHYVMILCYDTMLLYCVIILYYGTVLCHCCFNTALWCVVSAQYICEGNTIQISTVFLELTILRRMQLMLFLHNLSEIECLQLHKWDLTPWLKAARHRMPSI